MVFNARSLRNKTFGVCEYLKDNNCDLCFVTEAWIKLNDESIVAEILDMGYEIKFQPRKGSRRGGGVCVLYKPGLNVEKCKINSYKAFEVLQITVKGCDNSLLRVSALYRTGQMSVEKRSLFINELDQYLESIVELKGEHFLCGDLNIHVEDSTNANTNELFSITESFGYQQIVNQATHRDGGTLDLLFFKSESNTISLAKKSLFIHDLCYSMTSDHCFIECLVPFIRDPPKPLRSVSSYRNYRSIDLDEFCKDTESILNSLHCNYFNLDIDGAVINFEESMKVALDKHAPKINKCFTQKRTDFTNANILKLRRLRRQYERRYRKYKQPADHNKYKHFEKEVHKAVYSSRNEFFQGQFCNARGDKKKTFKLLNKVLGKNNKPVLPDCLSETDLCNDFEQFFMNKIVRIRNDISQSPIELPQSSPLPNQATKPFEEFKSLSKEDLFEIMSSMGNKHCELDIVPTDMFKAGSKTLLPYLLHIINSSLSTGNFPTPFKRALVKPILKNSALDKNVLSNYRPISNLSFLSKVLEKCVLKQLVGYLESNNMFGCFQSAYRQFHSCETAIAKISNDILHNLDCNDASFLILLDLSAAFDTVDHSVLFKRLQDQFHISGTVLKWFISYLSERSFHVKINCCLSNGVIIFYGVPQGSILGPILFLLYISEIEMIAQMHGFMIHMYADDMQLYISFKRNDLLNTVSTIEHCLRHIKLWMSSNFLKINESKTQLMLFLPNTHYNNIFSDLCLSFGGSIIFPSMIATNLGVTLDSSMSMSNHINLISSKGYFYIHNFHRVADKLTHDLKVQLITTYILPLIDYCNVIFTCATQAYRFKLQKLLNSAVRFVYNLCGRKRRVSITPYLKKLHFLSVEYRIIYKLCLLVYKCINGFAPQYLRELITPNIMYSSLRSSQDLFSLSLNIPRSTYGEHAFSYIAPYHWNKLPLGIRLSTSIDTFKKSLKTYLFSQCYGTETI